MSLIQVAILICLIEAGIAFVSFFLHGFTAEGFQILARFSGRYSLLTFLFWMAFANEKVLRRILSKRPFCAFAIVHGIHLMFVFAYLSVSGKTPVFSRLILGMITYGIIFLGPWLETFLLRKENRKFILLKRIYFLYLWIFFLFFLLPKTLKASGILEAYDLYILMALILLTLPLWILREFKVKKAI
ncbi:hypothetical protein A0128_10830 [Leptospira tipperaryensis]|uniref:Ferric oxidoreductase domain-containing protein n=1 Tax=Leptospira tipperaryensis TaxID=2564040 RepID=A0A1D7UXI4_9LEPT|nr:hypothetical protein [Leptospira tipperaryensis]AOP34298.1 hypothetical protein A0128_10830 [Leptospira tipperaryensis]